MAWLAGCGLWPGNSDESARPPGTRLDVPDGSIGVIAWLPDGDIYLRWTPKLGSGHRPMRVKPGQPAEPVDLPQVAGRRTDYLLPHRLPDGRLGLGRECITDDSSTTGFTLVAYDRATGRVEDLAPIGEYLPTEVSWRRDLHSGYLSPRLGHLRRLRAHHPSGHRATARPGHPGRAHLAAGRNLPPERG